MGKCGAAGATLTTHRHQDDHHRLGLATETGEEAGLRVAGGLDGTSPLCHRVFPETEKDSKQSSSQGRSGIELFVQALAPLVEGTVKDDSVSPIVFDHMMGNVQTMVLFDCYCGYLLNL